MKKLTTLSTATVIKVQFFHPQASGGTEFYFGSLAAIFEMFTPSEIGCRLENLWKSNITEERPKATSSCIISKHPLYRKSHKNK